MRFKQSNFCLRFLFLVIRQINLSPQFSMRDIVDSIKIHNYFFLGLNGMNYDHTMRKKCEPCIFIAFREMVREILQERMLNIDWYHANLKLLYSAQ